MFPWIGLLAGTLASKMGSADQRKAAAGEIMAKNAARMGGDTSAIEGAIANKQIENQESQGLSKLFINQLVGKLEDPKSTVGPGSKPQLGATEGNTGLRYENVLNPAGQPTQRMVPGMGLMGESEDDPYRQGWRR